MVRPQFILSSERVFGEWSQNPCYLQGKKSHLLEKFSPEDDRTHVAASNRTVSPTHYQRAILAPVGQYVRYSFVWESSIWQRLRVSIASVSCLKIPRLTCYHMYCQESKIHTSISRVQAHSCSQNRNTVQLSIAWVYLCLPVGLVVRVSASRVAGLGFDSRLHHGDISGSGRTSDLEIGPPVATLPGVWCYRPSPLTGLPDVSILWLGEIESWIYNFYLRVAAHKIE